MAEPKNEKEWAIYNELMKWYEGDKGAQQRVEHFKNNPKDQMSWEQYKVFEMEFG